METQNNAAKFAFYYMLSLVSLIFTAISVGIIIFQVINKNIVDPLSPFRGRFEPDAIKFAVAAIVVAAPIYFLMMWLINKSLSIGELSKESAIRKWLTYFIMFIASVVMIGYFIGIFYSYLDGDLTLKFALKALAAILISAIIFSYYLYDIKRAETKGNAGKVVKSYYFGAIALVVISLILGLTFGESPRETRERRLDENILRNFDRIKNGVNDFYNTQEKIPENFDELMSELNYISENDLEIPTTDKKIEYKVVDDKSYKLCAEFTTSNLEDDIRRGNYLEDLWKHDSGYHCIKTSVNDFSKGLRPAM